MDERPRLMYEFEKTLQGIEGCGYDDLRLKLVSMYRDAIEENAEDKDSGDDYIDDMILSRIENDSDCIEDLAVKLASHNTSFCAETL